MPTPLGQPMKGCESWEEEFKNMSALMSTLTLYMLIRQVITSHAILNWAMELKQSKAA